MKRLSMSIALLSLVACEAQVPNMVADSPELAGAPADGAVEASFRVGPVTDGIQTVWIRLTGTEAPVGSYQGSIQFDASQFTLVSAGMTDSDGTGDFGVVNEEEAGQGRLRFAGFSVQGFDVRDVIELRFRTRRPFESGEIGVSLDVVGLAEGEAVDQGNLVVSPAMLPMVTLELAH